MDFSELILKRQSTREYSDKPVERAKIEKCIEAARLAPSACNSQPWKYIVVDDKELKNKIAECAAGMGMNKFTFQAPVIVAIVLEKMNFTASIGSVIKNKEFSLLDIGLSVDQFCLQAAELNIGTCIMGWFKEKKVKQLLGVPYTKRVPLIITMGYSAAPQREKIRKQTDQIFSYNKY
jgi:nitroreductase